MGNFFNIKCEEANHICNKAQYNEATFTEKMKLKWHLLVCKVCALYTKQNRVLTKAYKCKSVDIKNGTKCLKKKDKEILKEEFKKVSI
ncbi:hypothetical protein [Tenacibaculum sp. IB213877]|uniref:hypothetical protein n=1 Tax=Tenacibaculum sp. IB213877 TaxID=3097351 RepID=UPI002A5A1C55|nr:hypothetical protein [Tenacibaculum sp. IB213877]MDY0781266.1 hypothetical protein [Tenacibaculum sp. IB213877]